MILKRRLEEAQDEHNMLCEINRKKDQKLNHISDKLERLRQKYRELTANTEEISADIEKGRNLLVDTIRELKQEITLKDIIIQNFVSPSLQDELLRRAKWDDSTEAWFLDPIDYNAHLSQGRPLSIDPKEMRPITEYEKQEQRRIRNVHNRDQFVRDLRFCRENILQFGLEMSNKTTYERFSRI